MATKDFEKDISQQTGKCVIVLEGVRVAVHASCRNLRCRSEENVYEMGELSFE